SLKPLQSENHTEEKVTNDDIEPPFDPDLREDTPYTPIQAEQQKVEDGFLYSRYRSGVTKCKVEKYSPGTPKRVENYKSAIEDFDAIIRINPQYIDTSAKRAYAHLVLGNHEAALADYETALDKQPNHAHYLNNRAILYRIIGEVDKAEADIQKAKLLEE